ncbi:E3 ubiquitin-protein ligase TRIM35-like isoform X2 [Brachyhypopomus gauderio]|uniref:E3 ubiquitin-protein ligase TRIM35-like isoform X2 n=1 Tax=Brachyhypopomus gauderio TaxID=698409 RepID=UPI004042DFB2
MASAIATLEQDLSCPVCFEVFREPVILSCSHSFCSACVRMSWTSSNRRECPVCRQASPEGNLLPDHALRNACQSYLQQRSYEDSSSQALLCSVHFQKLSLFCEDDQKLVCVECVANQHQNHCFCSLQKAADPLKKNLQHHLTCLETKCKVFKDIKDISDQLAAHFKTQVQQTEKHIKDEFKKLHQFLREEEQARIATLREEERVKRQVIKDEMDHLNKQIKDISERISEVKEILENDFLLLQDFKKTSQRAMYSVPDPAVVPGSLIDVARHLGNLRYSVWQKMKDICPYFPVVLDPNTGNSSLILSEDLSMVAYSDPKVRLPGNPERMSAYPGVLGSVGISSGIHSWVVEVGGSDDWAVGVAEETVLRQEYCTAIPEDGFYCLCRQVIKAMKKTTILSSSSKYLWIAVTGRVSKHKWKRSRRVSGKKDGLI